jgi:hypothetical protein
VINNDGVIGSPIRSHNAGAVAAMLRHRSGR